MLKSIWKNDLLKDTIGEANFNFLLKENFVKVSDDIIPVYDLQGCDWYCLDNYGYDTKIYISTEEIIVTEDISSMGRFIETKVIRKNINKNFEEAYNFIVDYVHKLVE